KTTLLRTLLGELKADEGTVRFGTNVDVAYFDQQLESVDQDANLIEAVRPPNCPHITPAHLRNLLGRFGLRGEIVFQRVGNLSGGEKSKVALARLAALNANVLVLDEPTNHLDLWARDALETALREFEGTLLFVSHDRYFLDQVATKLIALEPTRWRLYDGNYSAYIDSLRRAREELSVAEAQRQAAESRKGATSSANQPADPTRRRRKFPYRKVSDLEADIAKSESRLGQLESDLVSPELYRDGQKAKLAAQEFEDLRARIAELYEHWEEAVELN
ncbi:MAG: ABC-F family ATP-binding cassette domain-containing protein, partial [Planctomycetales bacterium]|nr:ABC-F family ATP-binding cassette domain-containing protein [Planctomycetales bacterium]